jgi:autotransporter-associated beta strand protein
MGVTAARRWLLALACAGAAAAPAAAATPRTILVTSDTVVMAVHDVRPHGPSRGDTVTYRDRLVNAVAQFGRPRGSTVGSDAGTLTFTGAHTATFRGTTRLPGGTLALVGAVYTLANGDLVIPVVSGTGSLAGLHGTLTVSSGRNHVLNTYRLTSTPPAIA